MNVRTAQKLRNMLLLVGFIILFAGRVWGLLFTIIGAVTIFSSLVIHTIYNKCPHCKKQLGKNEAEFCQHCGGKIDV